MTKAYSYVRFSAKKQELGDSVRRQIALSRKYAEENNLELDESTYRDLGVSAARGKNATAGKLGLFIAACDAGRIPKGSFLLVENLDRLSRQNVDVAYDQFRAILKFGVHIVTLHNGKVHSAGGRDIADILSSILEMHLAFEESAKKGRRISEVWASKRDRAQANTHKLTKACPAWLQLNADRKTFSVIAPRAAIVRRIFAMALNDGMGKNTIARRLNAEKVPTWGGSEGWRPGYVQKILTAISVHGAMQPHKFIDNKDGERVRVKAGAVIPDYFSAVIDLATFEKLRTRRQQQPISVGRKGEHFSNLFTGIGKCGACGAAFHLINRGKKGGIYLVCSSAHKGLGCKVRGWRYEPVESLLVRTLKKLDYSSLFPDIKDESRAVLEALENTKAERENILAATQRDLQIWAQGLAQAPAMRTLLELMATAEQKIDELTASLATLEQQIGQERSRSQHTERNFRQTQDGLSRLIAAHRTRGPKLYDLRSRLHQLLRRTVKTIQFFPASVMLGGKYPPPKPAEWQGTIAVSFHGSAVETHLHVRKKFTDAITVPVIRRKSDWAEAVQENPEAPWIEIRRS